MPRYNAGVAKGFDPDNAAQAIRDLGGTVEKVLQIIGIVTFTGAEDVADSVRLLEYISSVEEDGVMRATVSEPVNRHGTFIE